MTIHASQVKTAFFNSQPSESPYPHTYRALWSNTPYRSEIAKVKALLKDYTKESSFLGSFFGRLFSGHWNRHHVTKVNRIIQTTYESVEDLIYDLKLIKPRKGGSLDTRIQFIEEQRISSHPHLFAF